jgi:hypothetical protein
MDRVDTILKKYAEGLGIQMSCMWQADIDAIVDATTREVKWSYPEMLAGHDLIRFLIEADRLESNDKELHSLLLKVIGVQWQQDARVKFKQVELDTHNLLDLFIDVEAARVVAPNRTLALQDQRLNRTGPVGGTASYLLNALIPFTLVRGEPGQGKSTLGQYLTQVHRMEYLTERKATDPKRAILRADKPRIPLRIDLQDYGAWLDGQDPLTDTLDKKVREPVPRRRGSIEAFLAYFLESASGGIPATIALVNDIIERFPLLLVLDGLDEVASESTRGRVVNEIDNFCGRLQATDPPPQVVVSTRPNASNLPEPSPDIFETIALRPLNKTLRSSYLRKWSDARSIKGPHRRKLQKTFDERTAEPHIAQLADNPMQLTILLYLLQKRGESVPSGRTELYRSYMETFLDREASKSEAVQNNRADLEEVTAYLGWHIQARAESDGGTGQLSARAIRRAINEYLFRVGKDGSLVEELFKGVVDRVWALTSKVEGTFEFDVQPVREYFTAKYLYEYAGADNRRLQKSTILRELVRRPYWLNTGRFYAGFANPNEITGLAEGLEDEVEETLRHQQVRLAAWTLFSDRVFAARPRTEKRAARLLIDDLGIRLIDHALTTDSAGAIPTGDTLSSLLEELIADIHDDLASELSRARMRVASKVDAGGSRVVDWWLDNVDQAADPQETATWLQLAEPVRAAKKLPNSTLDSLRLDEVGSFAAALDAGVSTSPGSPLEQSLVQAVLDGLCSDVTVFGNGLASDLVAVLAPQHLLRTAMASADRAFVHTVGHPDQPMMDRHRLECFKRVERRDSRYSRVHAALNATRRTSSSAKSVVDTARALAKIEGSCWLAADIAMIGACRASLPGSIHVVSDPRRPPLGQDMDYGSLVQALQTNVDDPAWWAHQRQEHQDDLSQATWALALVAIANPSVVEANLDDLFFVLEGLPLRRRTALMTTSSRIGASGMSRLLPTELVGRAAGNSLESAILLSHHSCDRHSNGFLGDSLTVEESIEASQYGVSAWPALATLSSAMIANPSAELLKAISAYGSLAVVKVAAEEVDPRLYQYAREILSDAGAFPLAWVFEAERQVSSSGSVPALIDASESQEWFE